MSSSMLNVDCGYILGILETEYKVMVIMKAGNGDTNGLKRENKTVP